MLVAFTRRFLDSDVPALAGAFLATLMYVQFEFWHTAQAESFGYFLIVGAMYLSLDVGKRARPALAVFGLGLLYGLIFAMKPNLAARRRKISAFGNDSATGGITGSARCR